MAGQASEIFFSDMLRIAEAEVHLGYKTLKNKPAKLRGIKDFIHNVHYGLGVKDLSTFLCAVSQAAYKENNSNRYGYQFIDWLRTQDPCFEFPEELFQYRRLAKSIAKKRNINSRKKMWLFGVARFIYQNHPELLQQIGAGRKYANIEQCYFEEGFAEKKRVLKPIKIFRNPTNHQVHEMADILFERLGKGKTRVLIYRLLECCKNASLDTGRDGAGVSDLDPESAGAEWDDELGDLAPWASTAAEGEAQAGSWEELHLSSLPPVAE